MRTKRILAVALMAAVGLLTLVTPAQADNRRMTTSPPVPSLTNVSATTQTPALFTITGNDFTPGGRVYLAIYDQMGAKLYETRWITASLATTGMGHEAGDGPLGQTLMAIPGGSLHEAFANLCGATAMMRGYDETSTTWSDWLSVTPTCLSGTTTTEDRASAAPQAPATQPSPDYAAQMAGNESGGTFGFTAASATTRPPA
jgi:hypothetical protein